MFYIIKNKKNTLNYTKSLFYRLKKVSNLIKLKRLDIPALHIYYGNKLSQHNTQYQLMTTRAVGLKF
jgi:hypothetical protein